MLFSPIFLLEVENYEKHSKPRNMCELEDIGLVWLNIKGNIQKMNGHYDNMFDISYALRISSSIAMTWLV